ncbi:alpha/beta hydrolase-fold protein [soil metagenome]
MRLLTLLIFLTLCFASISAQNKPKKVSGKFITGTIYRYKAFDSKFVGIGRRIVDVWLPADYSKDKKYAVLYMHDGQNLFNPKDAVGGVEWGIDEILQNLISTKKVRETIVVAIWYSENRLKEFSPEKAFEYVNQRDAKQQKYKMPPGKGSDNYLKFIVEELKPFIDKNYSTLPDVENTFIMGSSMGGVMSLYAIIEYHEIFGGAACMSTHFSLGDGVMVDYMEQNLPAPKDHKIYFDYGTLGLDSEYKPYMIRADKALIKKGYKKDKNWKTIQFQGAAHDEISWRGRVDFPLMFLLGK